MRRTTRCALIGTVLLAAACAAPPAKLDSRLAQRAPDVLAEGLRAESPWVRVHAAEALLWHSLRTDDVKALFRAEEPSAGPQYRIGVWRVLARAALHPDERAQYVARVRQAFLDPQGPDRLHAVETLAKLDDKTPPDALRAALRRTAQDEPPAFQAFARWALVNAGETDREAGLADLLGQPGDSRRLAAYALRHLPSVSQATRAALARAAADTADAPAAAYVAAARYAHADDESREAARRALDPYLRPGAGEKADRYEAASALGQAGTLDDAPALAALLDDPDPDVRVAAAHGLLRIARRIPRHLEALDWAVIAAYALGMLAVGWYYSRRTKTQDDYLLGGRRMRPFAVGLSMFATLISTITYLAAPGEMIQYGPTYLCSVFAYPFIVAVVGWLVIPFIMQLRVTSAYEILETRLGPVARTLGSTFFLSMRLIWMAVIIYVTTAKVLLPLMGLDLSWTPYVCALLGAVTVAYTSMGGLRAVVLTDVIQTFILFGGALLTVIVVTVRMGGVSAWWPDAWPAHWPDPVLGFDPTARMTVAGILMAVFTWHVCTQSSDQMAIQRYLSTRDVRRARRVIVTSASCDVLVAALLGTLGLALLAYFQANPHMIADGSSVRESADRLFPRFIVAGLPAGLSGLVIAGLLAAAMSSLSSGVNASCSVITTDFIFRFRNKGAGDTARVRTARWVSVGVGVVVVLLSSGVGAVGGNILELTYKTTNLLTVPLAGMFFLAYLVPWATSFGAVTGAAAGLAVVVAVNYWEQLTGVRGIGFVWAMPLGLLAELAVGSLASLLPIGRRRPTETPEPAPEA